MSFLANDIFPAGIVLPYAGTTAPTGWLMCDGTSYLRTNYPRLFTAISTAHGSNAANTFNVPDYRGRFLRGSDNMGSGAAARDPNAATRTAANPGGNAGNLIGSVQSNATAKNGLSATAQSSSITASSEGAGGHSHTIGGHTNASGGGSDSRYATLTTYLTTNNNNKTSESVANHTHTISGTAAAQVITIGAGDSETRPLNVYVNYIIKI